MLTLGSGAQIAGEDLRRLAEEARRVRTVLAAFPTNYPRFIIEQMAIEGVLRPRISAEEVARVAKRLDSLAPDTERGSPDVVMILLPLKEKIPTCPKVPGALSL